MTEDTGQYVSLQRLAEEVSSRFKKDQDYVQRALLALTLDPVAVANRVNFVIDPVEAQKIRDTDAMEPAAATKLADDLLDGRRSLPSGLSLRIHNSDEDSEQGENPGQGSSVSEL